MQIPQDLIYRLIFEGDLKNATSDPASPLLCSSFLSLEEPNQKKTHAGDQLSSLQ